MGKAAFAAGLDPERALLIHKEMERVRMGFIMHGDLHMCFLVVPMEEDVLKKGVSGYQAMESIFSGMQVRALLPPTPPVSSDTVVLLRPGLPLW